MSEQAAKNPLRERLNPEGERGLTVVEPEQWGAPIPVSAMRERMGALAEERKLMQDFVQEVMIEGPDFGRVRGIPDPILKKPGAEKLAELYGLGQEIAEVHEDKNTETGYYRARVTVSLRRRDGSVASEGIGECSTMENRYRWRYQGQGQNRTKVQNDDPWSQWNTVLKMAKKRALVDAVLSATRSSELFTQDLEDSPRRGGDSGRQNQRSGQRQQEASPRSEASPPQEEKQKPTAADLAARFPWLAEFNQELKKRGIKSVDLKHVLGKPDAERVDLGDLHKWLTEGEQTVDVLFQMYDESVAPPPAEDDEEELETDDDDYEDGDFEDVPE